MTMTLWTCKGVLALTDEEKLALATCQHNFHWTSVVLCCDSALNYMIIVWKFFSVPFLEGFPERSKCNDVLVLHSPWLTKQLNPQGESEELHSWGGGCPCLQLCKWSSPISNPSRLTPLWRSSGFTMLGCKTTGTHPASHMGWCICAWGCSRLRKYLCGVSPPQKGCGWRLSAEWARRPPPPLGFGANFIIAWPLTTFYRSKCLKDI